MSSTSTKLFAASSSAQRLVLSLRGSMRKDKGRLTVAEIVPDVGRVPWTTMQDPTLRVDIVPTLRCHLRVPFVAPARVTTV